MANMLGKRHGEGVLHFGCSQCNSKTSRIAAKHTGRRREQREWQAEANAEALYLQQDHDDD